MGLRAGLKDDGVVDVAMWEAAFDTGALVGLCDRRGCGGALKVMPTNDGQAFETVGEIAWLSTRCLRCASEATFPNGRPKAPRRYPPKRKPTPKAYAAARAALAAMAEEATELDRRITGDRDRD